jgi:hypothetical protein
VDSCRKFLQNVGTYVPDLTALHPKDNNNQSIEELKSLKRMVAILSALPEPHFPLK